MPRGQALTHIEIRIVNNMLREGEGVRKIAKSVGISVGTVRKYQTKLLFEKHYKRSYTGFSDIPKQYYQDEAEIEFSLSPSYNFEDLSESEKEIFLSL